MWASAAPVKNRAAYASLGHSGHLPRVRDQTGTLSAFSLEQRPPSLRNAVRHQSGTASGIEWNTQFDAIDLVDLQREIGSRLRLKDDAMTQEKLTLDLRIK